MKMILVLAAIVATTVAVPMNSTSTRRVTPRPVAIVERTHHNNIGRGGYRYSYQQDDGQSRRESAEVVEVLDKEGNAVPAHRITGSYSFIHPKTNQEYTVTYVADHHGFVAHVPKVI